VITDISILKQVGDALWESKEQFRNLTEITSDWIWEVDKYEFYTYVSPKVQGMLGYKPEEIIGETPFDLMPPAEANRVSKIFNTIIASQQPFDSLENINLHKDGHPVVLETSGIPTFDVDGAFCGYRGIDRDITKRKRAEESLRKKTHDLDERVKELNCLYGISKIRERNDIAFEEMLQEIVDLIPSSWQYPEITCARIIIEGQEYKTKNFKETIWKQTSNIVVHGKRIGILEICYFEEKPEIDEGPFLKEERSLINAIAERFGRVTEHKQAERALQKAHDELEHRVKKRTRELEIKTNSLEEINIAMTVLLKKREEDKTELEDNVLTNVKELVEPYFEKIKKTKLDDHQEAFLSIIESNLKEIISPFTRKMSLKYLNLTPTEIRIANLIRHGSSSKKIAELQNVSPRTIDTHRKNIRRKIGLQGQRGNLRSHLLSLH
jgi:PAS domain S-box-containing protein